MKLRTALGERPRQESGRQEDRRDCLYTCIKTCDVGVNSPLRHTPLCHNGKLELGLILRLSLLSVVAVLHVVRTYRMT